MSNCSVWPIDRTLSGAITPGQSGPGSDGDGEVALLEPHYQMQFSDISQTLVEGES